MLKLNHPFYFMALIIMSMLMLSPLGRAEKKPVSDGMTSLDAITENNNRQHLLKNNYKEKFVTTPPPPYYTVMFSIQLSGKDTKNFEIANERMLEIASSIPGFIGAEGLQDADGFILFISYWKDMLSIETFKKNREHRIAQHHGKTLWFQKHVIKIAKVIDEYGEELN